MFVGFGVGGGVICMSLLVLYVVLVLGLVDRICVVFCNTA